MHGAGHKIAKLLILHTDGLLFYLQVDTPVFGYGDIVRISDDMVRVHSLQAGHGEWNDDMALVRR